MISCFSNFKSINLEPDSIITVNADRLSTTSFKRQRLRPSDKKGMFTMFCVNVFSH